MELQVKDTFMTWWTKQEFPCQLSWSFSGLCGPLHVLVYTSAKGVELYFFLQVNFKAWSVFRKCFKTDTRRNENAKCSLTFHPCYKVLLLQMTGSTFQGEIQGSVAPACCLEYKCEWSTDCSLPNWKCSVGIYWHGIIPRRKKKKKKAREKLDCTFFF